jgi:hypothetical protein
MTDAALLTNGDVTAFLVEQAIPRGYAYTLVDISVNKRLLQDEIPAAERLAILEGLEVCKEDRGWLTPKMVATVDPICAKGILIVGEAHKLDAGKTLDVYAEHFPTFAVLNPSLIAALEMLPGIRARMGAAA